MGPGSMTDTRPFLMNCSMSKLSTPGSFIKMLSFSGCLAKIVAPRTEVTALISVFRARPNDVVITVKYKESKSSNPSVSSPRFRFQGCQSVLEGYPEGTRQPLLPR